MEGPYVFVVSEIDVSLLVVTSVSLRVVRTVSVAVSVVLTLHQTISIARGEHQLALKSIDCLAFTHVSVFVEVSVLHLLARYLHISELQTHVRIVAVVVVPGSVVMVVLRSVTVILEVSVFGRSWVVLVVVIFSVIVDVGFVVVVVTVEAGS